MGIGNITHVDLVQVASSQEQVLIDFSSHDQNVSQFHFFQLGDQFFGLRRFDAEFLDNDQALLTYQLGQDATDSAAVHLLVYFLAVILRLSCKSHTTGTPNGRTDGASTGTTSTLLTLIMQHTRHPFVLAALFSGVGIGIALGNEYVLAGLHFDLSSQTLWQGAGALSGMMLIALTLLMPSKKHAITTMPLAKTEQQIMSWWLLAILYGLAGFGYIIVATYLPLMAKDAGSPLLTAHLWTLVGLSIVPGCFGWLWAAKRWGALPCLTANLLVQAICVLLTLASDSPLLLIISSLGFGGTFMGTTSLVMTIARQLSVPGNLNLLGFVTLIYGIGQILGPALTSMLGNGTSALAGATLCGAAALFIAALISTVQLFKLQVVTS